MPEICNACGHEHDNRYDGAVPDDLVGEMSCWLNGCSICTEKRRNEIIRCALCGVEMAMDEEAAEMASPVYMEKTSFGWVHSGPSLYDCRKRDTYLLPTGTLRGQHDSSSFKEV